jgi:glycosyltransferase involved in cell wall biosynthesis
VTETSDRTSSSSGGVSFVVPVHNGAACIRETLASIFAQADGRPREVIVVDDWSRDGSSALLRELALEWPIRILRGQGRGAPAAINVGVRAARFPVICQVDQDVVLAPDWLPLLLRGFSDERIAAVQGYYAADPAASLCARAMGFDLEQRYQAIDGDEVDHVCTGNAAYRAEALHAVGLFDERFGYGYDNDMSYRLKQAGYRLRFCRAARSVHRWREGLTGYVTQQYGFGYGRLDLVAKHPGRCAGDVVSPANMMAHPVLTAGAYLLLLAAALTALAGGPSRPLLAGGGVVLLGLAFERLAAGIEAARRFGDPTPLMFPVLHAARDLAWVGAMSVWSIRRLTGQPLLPSHSMRPRLPSPGGAGASPAAGLGIGPQPRRARPVLVLIPAHNEAASIPFVIDELRTCRPDVDILVIDDGSIDGTGACLRALGVRSLEFPERLGVGSAMRAGLRYAARLGYDIVVRIDGDGQHPVQEIERLLPPIEHGEADVVLGSRYSGLPMSSGGGAVRLVQRALAACLSAVTGQRITDPTSGFCALGPNAVALLAEHHPTGYSEPELRLFLKRNALRTTEVPVNGRSRKAGHTSLTAGRVAGAAARALLAMIVVPFRCRVAELSDD